MTTNKATMSISLRAAIGAVCLISAGLWASGVAAQTVPSRITLAIGTNAGGGYDLYGRLVARHIGRFLPGSPQVLPINMPGAGQLIMANWLHNVAPKDGSALGLIPSTTAFERLFGNTQANYEAQNFKWVGSLNGYTTVAVVWGESGARTPEDLFNREVVIGGGAPSSDVTIWPNLMNSLLKTKLRVVSGYVGTNQISMAMEAREVEGMVGADWDGIKLSKPDWVNQGRIRTLMQFGREPHPDLKSVPTVFKFTKGDEDRKLFELFIDRQAYGRPLAMPPGTPDSEVEAFRRAFQLMIKDASFIEDASKLGATIEAASGEEITTLVQRVYASEKSLLARGATELQHASK